MGVNDHLSVWFPRAIVARSWRGPVVIRFHLLLRCYRMALAEVSDLELLSLREIARGFNKGQVPLAHALRLLELDLIYSLLGDLRITTLGRSHLR
jgi:hypothetical protein